MLFIRSNLLHQQVKEEKSHVYIIDTKKPFDKSLTLIYD